VRERLVSREMVEGKLAVSRWAPTPKLTFRERLARLALDPHGSMLLAVVGTYRYLPSPLREGYILGPLTVFLWGFVGAWKAGQETQGLRETEGEDHRTSATVIYERHERELGRDQGLIDAGPGWIWFQGRRTEFCLATRRAEIESDLERGFARLDGYGTRIEISGLPKRDLEHLLDEIGIVRVPVAEIAPVRRRDPDLRVESVAGLMIAARIVLVVIAFLGSLFLPTASLVLTLIAWLLFLIGLARLIFRTRGTAPPK
jgi:hypothetical protein